MSTVAPGEVTVGEHAFPAIAAVPQGVERPFWSVVIPVYNRTQYLGECLASVLDQFPGHAGMEVLVIDDASSAPVSQVVAELGRGIVRFHRNPRNLGLPGGWNAGLSLSRGRWIHLLHDDDYVLPGFYARLGEALRECPASVGAACTGYENINEGGKVIFRSNLAGRGVAKEWLKRIGVKNFLTTPAVVVRREAYEKLGAYHPELTYTSDWELFKRIACFYDWWCEPQVLASYRRHRDRKTTEMFASGSHAASILRAIEISEGYLPRELRARITAVSRRYYFGHCLRIANLLLKDGNHAAVERVIADALKIDGSREAQAQLSAWREQAKWGVTRQP